ncbi:MAG: response regulator [Candidatus Acidiferrales bacterium]
MPTILVADDNSNIQKMVSLVFEEKGIRVVAVGNGEAACRKMAEVRPDIVLADIFMPVRSGYEVCEFVKQDSQFSGIPVILLVGAFDPLDEKEAKRVGADGVLKKPFVPPDPLIAMVTSLLPKIEPHVEPPAPPPKQEIPAALPPEWTPRHRAPAPSAYELREAVPEEFAYGTAPRDFDEPADTVPAFGEPVATPAAKHAENEDDFEEPVSEWKRRRNTVEYDIPAAESASMVEKLSGQATAEDLPFLDTKGASEATHVPFGGANVPEKIDPHPMPARDEWMDLMEIPQAKKGDPATGPREVPVPAEPELSELVEKDPPAGASRNEFSSNPSISISSNLRAIEREAPAFDYTPREETPQHEALHYDERRVEPDAPDEQVASHEAPLQREELPKYDARHPESDAAPERLPWEEEQPRDGVSSSEEDWRLDPMRARQTDWPAPPAEAIPFPAPPEIASASAFEVPNASRDAEIATHETHEEFSYVAEPLEGVAGSGKSAPEETPETPTEVSATDSAVHSEPYEKEPPAQAADAAPARSSEMDPAAIDSVVAKLLEKLEPQIHQALSNGILRPLVEEMLNRERDKK